MKHLRHDIEERVTGTPFIVVGSGKTSGPPDPVAVWSAFQKGSTVAFKLIYDAHVDMLYAYGKRIFADESQVKDCIQDLFVDLWRTREKLGKVVDIKVYLAVSLRRRLFSLLKKQRSFRNYTCDEDLDRLVEPVLEARDTESDRSVKMLNGLLNALPERQQEAIFLRFFNKLSCGEIAEIMNINEQSVYNLIHRAIRIMRKRSL